MNGRTWNSSSPASLLLLIIVISLVTAAGCGGVAGTATAPTTPSSSGTGGTGGTGSTGSNATTGAVVTWKYNTARTGLNDKEVTLNVNSVSSSNFGRLHSYAVDGEIFAQPLYVPGMTIHGAKHNVIFIATEHASVFAFDADAAGDPLWKRSLVPDGATPVPNINVNDPGGRTSLGDEVGITGTPVIDLDSNTMYVSAMTWENGDAVHRLYALDTTTGQNRVAPVVETATVPGTGIGSVNGQITFKSLHQNQRPGLALAGGLVYVAWASFSDIGEYHGWIMAFDAGTLQQVAAINLSPGTEGAGIWQAGGAPAIDANGYLYYTTADGANRGDEGGPNWGDSLLKLKVVNGAFQIADWFTPHNEFCLDGNDMDLGSGVPMFFPDGAASVPLLTIGSKEGRLYLINRDHLGNFMPNTDNVQQQILLSPTACDLAVGTQYDTKRIYGGTAYWNNTVYLGTAHGNMLAFKLSNGQLAQSSQSSDMFAERGPVPVVSANGNTDGIVWIADYNTSTHHTTLKAYDANDLGRVLFSEDIGPGETFSVPVVINGKVYVAKQGAVLAYGLK